MWLASSLGVPADFCYSRSGRSSVVLSPVTLLSCRPSVLPALSFSTSAAWGQVLLPGEGLFWRVTSTSGLLCTCRQHPDPPVPSITTKCASGGPAAPVELAFGSQAGAPPRTQAWRREPLPRRAGAPLPVPALSVRGSPTHLAAESHCSRIAQLSMFI